jgi:hypothetical protein
VERIGIREAARRLGVSDTAVHKALKSGRVQYAQPHNILKPQVEWPTIRDQWDQNTDTGYRTHSGKKDAPRPEQAPERPPAAAPQAAPPDRREFSSSTPQPEGPSFARSRAIREAYNAQLAKLDFEERSGRLVSVAQVRADGIKLAATIITGMYNIPERCADEIAGMTDANQIHALLVREIDAAVSELRRQYGSPQ